MSNDQQTPDSPSQDAVPGHGLGVLRIATRMTVVNVTAGPARRNRWLTPLLNFICWLQRREGFHGTIRLHWYVDGVPTNISEGSVTHEKNTLEQSCLIQISGGGSAAAACEEIRARQRAEMLDSPDRRN